MCFVNTYEVEVTYDTRNDSPYNCGKETADGGKFDYEVPTHSDFNYQYHKWLGDTDMGQSTANQDMPNMAETCTVENGRNFLVSWNALEAKTKPCKTCDDVCTKTGCVALCEEGCDACATGCPTGCTPGCTPYLDEGCTALCDTPDCRQCFPTGPCTPGCTPACDPECVPEPGSGSGSGSGQSLGPGQEYCTADCVPGCDATEKVYEIGGTNYTSKCLPGIESVPGCVDTETNPTCQSESGCDPGCVDLCEAGCKPRCGESYLLCDSPVCEAGCNMECDAGCTAGCTPDITPGCTDACTKPECNSQAACAPGCACVEGCVESCADRKSVV